MVELRLPPNSRIRTGVTHKAPAGATDVRTFRIYRYDPTS
jgi:succinate dehydrogenase / fumarate reductase, iron-sulfur subunit